MQRYISGLSEPFQRSMFHSYYITTLFPVLYLWNTWSLLSLYSKALKTRITLFRTLSVHTKFWNEKVWVLQIYFQISHNCLAVYFQWVLIFPFIWVCQFFVKKKIAKFLQGFHWIRRSRGDVIILALFGLSN